MNATVTALETIGFSLAVAAFVIALLLFFMGGPFYRHRGPTAQPPDAPGTRRGSAAG